MSSSDYVPSEDNSNNSEMPDLITSEDFLGPESNKATEVSPPSLSSSATESPSEEILDSFTCKTLESTVTVALAKVSLSSGDKPPESQSLQKDHVKADSPIFVGASATSVFYPLDWFKGKYPESSMGSPFLQPLVTGRSFSLSQLDQFDDAALEAYRSIDRSCTPIPAGFWREYERIDSLMDFMLRYFDTSLPNEEWVHRRLMEGSRPSDVLKRFLHIIILFLNYIFRLLGPFFF